MPTRVLQRMMVLLPLMLPAACGSVGSMSDSGVASDAQGAIDGPQPRFCDSKDPALVACYEFEPASPPASLLDGSSYGNSGTLSGVSYVAGHDGMAISLSPSISRVVVPDSTSLDVASLTIELWVKTDTLVAANARAGLLDNNNQYAIFILPQNVIECASATQAQSTDATRIDTTVAIDIGRWTHVACTYDGPTMLARAYLNGANVAMGMGTSSTVSGAGTTGLAIGANSPCAAAPCMDAFSGAIDGIRIWSRARTAAEICADAGRTGC